jgi:large subunit ribosomal protein L18
MDKIESRTRRKKGIRKKIYGTPDKPRITVFRSNRHLFVQAVDDTAGKTIASSSDIQSKVKRTKEGAVVVGEKLAEKLTGLQVQRAVFDRNGYLYHGVISAVAEGVRKGDIQV